MDFSNLHRMTVEEETEFFNNLSLDWWNENGKTILLHRFNELSIMFLQENSTSHKDLKILEVGCGGGILTERLAKVYGNVVAIDIAEDLLNTAKQHATLDPSLTNITFHLESIQDHSLNNQEKYDIVVSNFVLEHVDDPEQFLEDCIKCLKPGGSIFVSSFNKTAIAWLVGIFLWENILRLIPVGQHDWSKFVLLDDVRKVFRRNKCSEIDVKGYGYNMFTRKGFWLNNTSITYLVGAVRN